MKSKFIFKMIIYSILLVLVVLGAKNLVEKKAKFSKEPLMTVTYDGSNQVVHPSIVYKKDKFNGYKYWMAITPYPKGNDKFENPSILVSNNGIQWSVPKGVVNPIVKLPKDIKNGGHLSDPMLFMANNKLELWYRYNPSDGKGKANNSKNIIYRVVSDDGINWSEEEVIFNTKLDGETYYFYSPTISYENNTYKLWFSNGSNELLYTESKDLKEWNKPKKCELNSGNYDIWHQEIRKLDKGYEIIYCAFNKEKGFEDMDLFYSKSVDGINWDEGKVILDNIYDNKLKILYKASMIKKDNEELYSIYYTASQKNGEWYLYLTEGKTPYDLKGVNR